LANSTRGERCRDDDDEDDEEILEGDGEEDGKGLAKVGRGSSTSMGLEEGQQYLLRLRRRRS